MGNSTQEKENLDENHDLAVSAAGDNILKRQAIEVTEEARMKEYKLPSFGAQLFMGDFNPSLLFPFPQQNEEDSQEAEPVIEKLMDFLLKNLDPEEVDATRTIPKHVIEEMGRMGIFALKIPKEYGGLGFSQTNYCRLVMNVASYCGGTATLISAHQSIGVPQPLKLFGTEEQKKRYFPRFCQGAISAFALTEPDVGSDPAQMSCTAELSEDGKSYLLNGDKLWCTNGALAEVIVVMAKTAPKMIKGKERKQITAFIVEMNWPGVEIVHRCEFMGLGGIYNALLKFTNVKIPVENIIGSEGRGLALALATINVGRLTLPAASTGAAKQCLKIARIWGSQRIQWGMPVGLHEAGREKIAYIAATTMAMEAITWLTSAWADLQNVDIRIEAAMAKLFCTESLWTIVDLTLQLRGGRGYEKARSLKARGEPGYPVERIMRDCRINTILEGSSEIMKLFLAREAIDPHLKRAGGLLNPKASLVEKLKTMMHLIGFYSRWYPKQRYALLRKHPTFKELGDLEKHYHFIEKSSHQLSLAIFNAMAKYKQNLEKRQLLLGRLMDIGTDLFAMAATCSYAQFLKGKKDFQRNPHEMADLFCTLARRRIAKNFEAIAHNDDRVINHMAKKVVGDEFKWLESGVVSIPGE